MSRTTKTKKKDPRERNYCFNINNPTEEQIEFYQSIPENLKISRGICSEEYGSENGHHHLHVYLELVSGKTWTAMQKWLGKDNVNDLQVRAGTAHEAWVYVAKDGSLLWEVGEAPEESYTSNGDAWVVIQQMVKDGASYLEICDKYPKFGIRNGTQIQRYMLEYQRNTMESKRPVQVTYVHGTTGSGKTHAIMTAMGGMREVFRVTNYKHPFDGYAGQKTIVFEEFRSSLPLTEMLTYLECWVTPLKCRYADRMSDYTRVFVISNLSLQSQYSKMQNEMEQVWDEEVRDGMQRSYNAFLRRFEICDGMWNDLGWDGLDIVTITSREDSNKFQTRLLTEQNQEEEE